MIYDIFIITIVIFLCLRSYRMWKKIDEKNLKTFLALQRSRCVKCSRPCHGSAAVMRCTMPTCRAPFHKSCMLRDIQETMRCPNCKFAILSPNFTKMKRGWLLSHRNYFFIKGAINDLGIVLGIALALFTLHGAVNNTYGSDHSDE